MKRMAVSPILAVSGVLFASFVPVSRAAQDSDTGNLEVRRRPNILFIMTDQQHAGMMSCTGNRNLKTPAMDSLAARGMRFDRAYATNPVCTPSRFSLQTGRMPSAIGMRMNKQNLPVPEQISENSLGPLLRKAGYNCVYGGKDHTPGPLSRFMMSKGYKKLTGEERKGLAEACASFLKGPHEKPFFLIASFINPHDICYMIMHDRDRHEGKNIVYPKEGSRNCRRIVDQLRKREDLQRFIREECPPLPGNFDIPKDEPEAILRMVKETSRYYGREHWSKDDWRLFRWVYAHLTETVDAEIGIVLAALKESGLEDDTLVVFTSDHGDMDAAHQLAYKSLLYEESVRIPFIMARKGAIPAGRVDQKHLVSNGLDLLPTLCDYAGIEPPAGLPGRSLRPLAEGRDVPDWRSEVFVESENGRMVRTARYKYCVYDSGERRETLVDLERDPGEMNNLATSPQHRDELNRHRRLLMIWCEQQKDKLGLSYAVRPEAGSQ